MVCVSEKEKEREREILCKFSLSISNVTNLRSLNLMGNNMKCFGFFQSLLLIFPFINAALRRSHNILVPFSLEGFIISISNSIQI